MKIRNIQKESSSSSFKSIDSNLSDFSYKSLLRSDSSKQYENTNTSDTNSTSVNIEEPQLKIDKNTLTTSISMPQFFSAELSGLKKCSSESGLDKYGTVPDIFNMPSTSASTMSSKTSNTSEDLPCTSRSLPLPVVHTIHKMKKSDSYTAGGISSLGTKIKTTFGGSDNSKLIKKKRNVRHDSLIVKRKKSKVKMTRH